MNFSSELIRYIIDGLQTYRKINGQLYLAGRPSSFFLPHDKSAQEVGGLLFPGKDKYYFAKNDNPNVLAERLVTKEEIQEIFNDAIKEL